MAGSHIETVRAYWDATERADWEAAARCVGSGFTWVDHTLGEGLTDLELATQEAQAWSDQKYEINQAYECSDGVLILQTTWTRTLAAPWRSVEPTGQRVRTGICSIFRFDGDGRIVSEETYEDALDVMRQLGAVLA